MTLGPLCSMLAVVFFAACACGRPAEPVSSRVAVDLGNVNAEGLRGGPGALRAVHYEFCIPADERHAAEIRAIDPTAQLMPGSRGRIGCPKAQTLVVGSTHQPGYRQVLDRLVARPYVARIVEAFFE